ncbi:MAG: type IV pilin protein [Gammaproteobacteria bacterium]
MSAPVKRGFTLIELMVVVAVIGILAAIAYPSYQDHVRRGNRADAKTVLLETAQFLERNFTEANRYNQTSAGGAVTLPFTQSPKTGTARYTIGGALAATTYTLTATRAGGMVGDPCGDLTLTETGVQGVINQPAGATITAAECWQR